MTRITKPSDFKDKHYIIMKLKLNKVKHSLTMAFALAISLALVSQVTEVQVRMIDSTFVSTYLQFGNFHTENSHPVIGGENIITWDHGSGLYQNIPGYYVGWSNTERVDENTALLFNEVPGQSYKLFKLNEIQDTQSYEDSLSAWFTSIGIPVGMAETNETGFSLVPNPVKQNAVLQVKTEASEAWSLSIYDVSGRLLYNTHYKSESNELRIELPFSA